MARRVFYSFHYVPDSWRAGQVRNIGTVEGNSAVSDNDWETVTKGGDAAIETWIAEQMKGRSCTVVLVGTNTANRKWIDHEICKTWEDKKGIVGIHVHGLKDANSAVSSKGSNPFSHLTLGDKKLSSIVKCYDPPGSSSNDRYAWISNNLEAMVEEAVKIRDDY